MDLIYFLFYFEAISLVCLMLDYFLTLSWFPSLPRPDVFYYPRLPCVFKSRVNSCELHFVFPVRRAPTFSVFVFPAWFFEFLFL